MLFGEPVPAYCEDRTEHTDTLCGQDAVRTSQETHYLSTTEPNRLMLFGGKKSPSVVRTVRSIQIQCVGRMLRFINLRQVVRTLTIEH
jgi:hypothetical protein